MPAAVDQPPNRAGQQRVVTLPIDLLRHQLLLTREPIDETTLAEITDDVFLPLVHAHRSGSA